MNILENLKNRRLYFDGAMGTLLQQKRLKTGECTEQWNITHPEEITAVHKSYIDSGADILCANTFGVNSLKYADCEPYIAAAFDCAKKAVGGMENKYIALDIGPLGKLLKPLGDLDFEKAVEIFANTVRIGVKYGADLILIETMNDLYETKAAVLAAKENSDLPIFVTNAYGEDGKLMTGADPKTVIATLEGLGVDAIGLNCSVGPDKMLPVIKTYGKYCSLPIIVSPNAGLPELKNGKTVYDITADDFAKCMQKIATIGATVLGGCCGTTPEYIKATKDLTCNLELPERKVTPKTVISSYTHTVEFGDIPILIGERINPTGKKLIKEALREKNYSYILSEGVNQADAGVHVLDINAGLPEIDEADALCSLVYGMQSVSNLPLQIDTSNSLALEKSLRIYNGKPLINSVSGTKKSMSEVFPLAKKYGGVIIALTISEDGIPDTAEGRLAVAENIVREAQKYGIKKQDIIVDPLCMTVSSDTQSANITLNSVKLIKEKLGVPCSLGVSNISFGLPKRDLINSCFFTLSLNAGLDAAIMNPFSAQMMNAYYSFLALSGKDKNFNKYIEYSETVADSTATVSTVFSKKKSAMDSELTLSRAIIKGLTAEVKSTTEQLLLTKNPMDLIESEIIPALNEIGTAFEQGKAYLPQLLISAEAASEAFKVIKTKLPSSADTSKKIVLATVKGDIHDIGKNIVKVLLENYGFFVEDLGKDVDPEIIVAAAKNAKIVGLSALMTTTVPAMEETIKRIKETYPDTFIVVGGAVLTKEYADMIGADLYCKDAMDTVRAAQKIFG